MLGLVTCGAAVATAFAEEFWHVIISYSIIQCIFAIPFVHVHILVILILLLIAAWLMGL